MVGKSFTKRTDYSNEHFEGFFRSVSYAAIFCGFLALWISGTIGLVATVLFLGSLIAAWALEGSRWQIGEKLGTSLIVLSLPAFYAAWQIFPGDGDAIWIAGLLARMILFLTAIKLLQRKSERDWIFLYLMGFFEVLLAAGLSISGLYLVNFLVYILLMACAVIAFEIRKTSVRVERELKSVYTGQRGSGTVRSQLRAARIPSSAVAIVFLIVLLAVPLFFLLPRVGGAGLGSAQRGMSRSGFSDKVTLGKFGRITEDDRPVMRVKFDDKAAVTNNLYFRGVALDTFDNNSWSQSKADLPKLASHTLPNSYIVGTGRGRGNVVRQTIYLEPIETPVLFALPRAISIEGNFESLTVDYGDAIRHTRSFERISYKAVSDPNLPELKELQADRAPYTTDDLPYRSLPPNLDPRIAELAEQLTRTFNNRYDKARAVEVYLQTNFGYSLDQTASGEDPLADFLFDVKQGHCEYFASAMAILLRTQGISTRIVNGFHGGDYNETAQLTVVRQRHAHAWVEVHFPGSDTWVTFDPTPVGAQPGDAGSSGVSGAFSNYVEALEAIWIEYFVAFDDGGQEKLRRSAEGGFAKFQTMVTAAVGVAHHLTEEWLRATDGRNATGRFLPSLLYFCGVVLGGAVAAYALFWIIFRSRLATQIARLFRSWLAPRRPVKTVEFYEKLIALLAARGLRRSTSETPWEFALATNLPEALTITEMYQQVRFGERTLSESDFTQMSKLIKQLEQQERR